MTRMEVVRFLEAGGAAAAAEGYSLRETLFDLLRDPGEADPLTPAAHEERRDTLDTLTRRLVKVRFFGADDRILLTPEAAERLRDIGYGR